MNAIRAEIAGDAAAIHTVNMEAAECHEAEPSLVEAIPHYGKFHP